jgi:hypothetical protein
MAGRYRILLQYKADHIYRVLLFIQDILVKNLTAILCGGALLSI